MFGILAVNSFPSDVERAQQDEEYLEKFIKENQKFIKISAYKAVGHFITENDDEWSVSLIAFHEAVRSYAPSKGSFKAFAALVIKRRLADYYDSQARHRAEISLEPESMDGDVEDETATPLQLEVRAESARLSEQQAASISGSAAIRDEILAAQEILGRYGFSFFDLTDCSPKSEKTKKSCVRAVVTLLQNRDLLEKMRDSRALPAKEITKRSGLPRKILERHRKYIIAAAEIMDGEYPLLREYLDDIRKALRDESSCS